MTTVTYLLIAVAVICLLLVIVPWAWKKLAAANDRAVDRMVTEALGEDEK